MRTPKMTDTKQVWCMELCLSPFLLSRQQKCGINQDRQSRSAVVGQTHMGLQERVKVGVKLKVPGSKVLRVNQPDHQKIEPQPKRFSRQMGSDQPRALSATCLLEKFFPERESPEKVTSCGLDVNGTSCHLDSQWFWFVDPKSSKTHLLRILGHGTSKHLSFLLPAVFACDKGVTLFMIPTDKTHRRSSSTNRKWPLVVNSGYSTFPTLY